GYGVVLEEIAEHVRHGPKVNSSAPVFNGPVESNHRLVWHSLEQRNVANEHPFHTGVRIVERNIRPKAARYVANEDGAEPRPAGRRDRRASAFFPPHGEAAFRIDVPAN